jgi:hypothetical protein
MPPKMAATQKGTLVRYLRKTAYIAVLILHPQSDLGVLLLEPTQPREASLVVLEEGVEEAAQRDSADLLFPLRPRLMPIVRDCNPTVRALDSRPGGAIMTENSGEGRRTLR